MSKKHKTEELKETDIRELKHFVSPQGYEVIGYFGTDGKLDFYKGSIRVKFGNDMLALQWNYPHEYTLLQCFEEFNDRAQNEIKKFQDGLSKKEQD